MRCASNARWTTTGERPGRRYTGAMRIAFRLPVVALLLGLLTLTAACGNKGELVRPGAPPAAARE